MLETLLIIILLPIAAGIVFTVLGGVVGTVLTPFAMGAEALSEWYDEGGGRKVVLIAAALACGALAIFGAIVGVR
jgi:hypothetical protein